MVLNAVLMFFRRIQKTGVNPHMLQRYRALGWATGLTGAEARQKAKDIREAIQ